MKLIRSDIVGSCISSAKFGDCFVFPGTHMYVFMKVNSTEKHPDKFCYVSLASGELYYMAENAKIIPVRVEATVYD